nr:uncharacterized protein LOC117276815 [Nicotiana tomentosiformis]
MEEKAENFVARCNKCQRYSNNMHRPAELLHSFISPWTFMKWGMDIVGSLPQAKEKARFLQAESTSKVIINNLKKRLEESKGKWLEVLPGVIWAYRTTTKTSTGENPFSLVNGAEALIPVEIGEPSTRKANLRYFKIGDFVLKKVFRSTKVANAGKLSPNWEGLYRVRGIAGK